MSNLKWSDSWFVLKSGDWGGRADGQGKDVFSRDGRVWQSGLDWVMKGEPKSVRDIKWEEWEESEGPESDRE
jgi:hypothetical protein